MAIIESLLTINNKITTGTGNIQHISRIFSATIFVFVCSGFNKNSVLAIRFLLTEVMCVYISCLQMLWNFFSMDTLFLVSIFDCNMLEILFIWNLEDSVALFFGQHRTEKKIKWHLIYWNYSCFGIKNTMHKGGSTLILCKESFILVKSTKNSN